MSEDRCIICGEIIPEGRQVCPICEKEKLMKCNHFKEYPDCSFHYNGLCLRDHIYECPPLMNMKNLSHGEMVQIAEGRKKQPPRYIDANRLIDLATREGAYGYVDVHDIRNTPTADVAERKRGRWIKNDFYEDALMCSCCNAYLDKEDWSRHYFYFCHHCGAFMEGMDVGEEKTDG